VNTVPLYYIVERLTRLQRAKSVYQCAFRESQSRPARGPGATFRRSSSTVPFHSGTSAKYNALAITSRHRRGQQHESPDNRSEREDRRHRRSCKGCRNRTGDDDEYDRTSWARTPVCGTAEPRLPFVTSAAPPSTTDIATMTITYLRNDALCNAGAIAPLSALSTESAPSYRSSVPYRGLHVRVRTALCTTYADPTAASVSTLSSRVGVIPCHTISFCKVSQLALGLRRHRGPRSRRAPKLGGLRIGELQQCAGLLERETRQSWKHLRWIPVTKVAYEVRLDMTCGNEFLLTVVTRLAPAEEFVVDFCVVES
jgi:hypothetical protein